MAGWGPLLRAVRLDPCASAPTRPCAGFRAARGRDIADPPGGTARSVKSSANLQGVDDQFGADVIGDRPAHHRAAEHIEHGAAVDLAGAGRMFCHVSAPQPVRSVGDKPALHQILVRGRCRPMAALTVGVPADPGRPDDPQQPRHPLTPHPHLHAKAQFGMHPRRPAGGDHGVPGRQVHRQEPYFGSTFSLAK
jgi:hypothetical protein